ncbi:MAG: type II toxin-antitoxin system RelE/ParE family toxin [Oscillospiraceae bacterium]|nr:type II toxin-antitoxin system RelE/ParE family toxin [Oscillospiraceae bacterium]
MIISTFEFDKQWEKMGLTDNERRLLENEILCNPHLGAVIKGTSGLRKIRFAIEGQGKRGGSRVLYIDFVVYRRVYLITAYPKNQKVDITADEKTLFNKLIEQTKKELEGKL